jgi:hypothetical protein
MTSIHQNDHFGLKSLAAACCAAAAMVALPAHAAVEALTPAINIDSHDLFVGNTGGANTIAGIDNWDTLGYAMSVFNPDGSGKGTDYIVQRLQNFTGDPLGALPGAGYSIGVAAVVDFQLRSLTPNVSGELPYDFTSLRYFRVFLQNTENGTITASININNLGAVLSGLEVLSGTQLTSLADPLSANGGKYGTNSGFTNANSVYQGQFMQENNLVAGNDFCVDDPAGGCQPFMQVGGQSIFDYLNGIGLSVLAQMSTGDNRVPDASVRNLVDDGTAVSDADIQAASTLMYNAFVGINAWFGPFGPESDFWDSNVLVYTVGADPQTDFAAVPEPATLGLVGLSLLGLGALRRRRAHA